MTLDEFNHIFESFWFIYFLMYIPIIFFSIMAFDPNTSSDILDAKTYFRWFIAWPVLIPLWFLFWTFVFFEWLLSEKEPFVSRFQFVFDETPNKKETKK